MHCCLKNQAEMDATDLEVFDSPSQNSHSILGRVQFLVNISVDYL